MSDFDYETGVRGRGEPGASGGLGILLVLLVIVALLVLFSFFGGGPAPDPAATSGANAVPAGSAPVTGAPEVSRQPVGD